MARTRKTTATVEQPESVVVELQPGIEGEAPVEQLDEPATTDEQPEADEPTGAPARFRGPALNRVELIGRIARAADLRVTPAGMHVAYFRVATNGLREQDTEFHQCTAFGSTASFIGEYLSVGRLVHLEGRLQTRSYQDRDGVRRWVTAIVVSRLQVLDQRRRDEAER